MRDTSTNFLFEFPCSISRSTLLVRGEALTARCRSDNPTPGPPAHNRTPPDRRALRLRGTPAGAPRSKFATFRWPPPSAVRRGLWLPPMARSRARHSPATDRAANTSVRAASNDRSGFLPRREDRAEVTHVRDHIDPFRPPRRERP